MERVNDISKLKLRTGEYLIKIVEKDSKVVLLDGNKDLVAYAEIVLINDPESNLNIGDVILDFTTKRVFKWHKTKYAILLRHEIALAVAKENFIYDASLN